MTVRVRPITDADVRPVAEFLHAHLNTRVPADSWADAMRVPWQVDAPNHGFALVDEANGADAIVGAYLAFYSTRQIEGRTERFCNLGAWCVRPGQRLHSVKLLKALLAQDGYHFTDLSPSGNVVPLNTRLKFRFLDTTTALMPNLPWPSLPGRYRISSDPAVIEATLTGGELRLYRDHARTRAAHHVVLTRGDQWCYVIFRRDRRRNLPLFASILHVSDPALFRAMTRPLSRHLLLRHGIVASLAELRVVNHRPRPSLLLRAHRRKMFRSPLEPDQIDYLYSELVCVAW
jgi:hypothetical protein